MIEAAASQPSFKKPPAASPARDMSTDHLLHSPKVNRATARRHSGIIVVSGGGGGKVV